MGPDPYRWEDFMIEVRPMNPVYVVGDPDPSIARFADSEWRNLIELARRHGFEPPDIQSYYPRAYGHPVEIGAEASQRLYEAISAAYTDEVVPYASTLEDSNTNEIPHIHPELHVGKLQVKQFMECVEIGAGQGGIEIQLRG
jgi:hypothetical protein